MISTAKSVRASLGGIVLLMGPLIMQEGNVASASDQHKSAEAREADGKKGEGLPCNIPPGQNAAHAEQDANLASRLITGKLIKVDGSNYVVKEESGKEVRFQTTERTEITPVHQGDYISVAVNNHNQASWIRANRGTDRRTEHASADCNPN